MFSFLKKLNNIEHVIGNLVYIYKIISTNSSTRKTANIVSTNSYVVTFTEKFYLSAKKNHVYKSISFNYESDMKPVFVANFPFTILIYLSGIDMNSKTFFLDFCYDLITRVFW